MGVNGQGVRGSRHVVNIESTATAEDIIAAACIKISAHSAKFDVSQKNVLLYPDGTIVQTLPQGVEAFTLQKYRDQLLKDFGKITLYIRPGN